MNKLHQLQEDFQEYILHQAKEITEKITSDKKSLHVEKLAVYSKGYYLRLTEVLAADFLKLKKFMGDKVFSQMAKDYIDDYPSHHFAIRYFGCNLFQFLKNSTEYAPICAELAAFEWALAAALDAADAPHLCFNDLATIPPEEWGNMRLKTHPSLQKLLFFYNVLDLWNALNKGETIPKTAVYTKKTATCLVWRWNHESYFRLLTTGPEVRMIQAIQEGKTFSKICEDLCEWMDENEVPSFAANTLRSWTDEGIFTEIIFENNNEN